MKIEDYNKYYIQGSDHYLIPKDEFKELFNEMVNWREESNKKKEVIDKATNELFILKDMIYKPETREENFEIQRKISSIIKRLNGKEILQKYKSIIGVSDENNMGK